MTRRKNNNGLSPFKFSILNIIFIIIFIYLVFQIILSFQKKSYSIYEVKNSYIDNNINTTALIVRKEELIETKLSGYVSYYIRDGEKIGKNKLIYTIDETGSVYEKLNNEADSSKLLTDYGLDEIRSRISDFENYFDFSNYQDIYNFKYDIDNCVLEFTNEAYMEQITTIENNSKDVSTYKKVYTEQSGIVTYYQDGYENFNLDKFDADDVLKDNYKKKTLKTNELIKTGEPVYKIVTSENWQIVAPITSENVNDISKLDKVEININNSSKNIICDFELTKKNNQDFIIIKLNEQMVNYINERFIDIVIIMDQKNGLKVPNSAITTKKVYKIPISYFSNGSNSYDKKFLNIKQMDDKGEVTINQIEPIIFKIDKKYVYVNPDQFKGNEIIINTENNKSIAISKTKKEKIKGVYCVNQGTAIFRYLDILYEDNDYCIVKNDVPYSIAWYDRIILNQEFVKENQIIK